MITTIDLAQYNPDTVIAPNSHGISEEYSTTTWWSSKKARYGSALWGQFHIFINTAGNSGVMVWMKEYEPRVSLWKVNAGDDTLTIEFEDDLPAPIIYETALSSNNWKDYADIYKAWAKTAPWYRKTHRYPSHVNYVFSGGTNSPTLLTTYAQYMNAVFSSGKVIFISNCYTKFKFNEAGVGAVSGSHPDYTLNTNFDQSFTDIKNSNVIAMPYVNTTIWDDEDTGYDPEDMIWSKPQDITSLTEVGGGDYTLTLPANFSSWNQQSLVVDDDIAIVDTSNENHNNVVFRISAVASQQSFTVTQSAGLGSSTGGYAQEVVCYTHDADDAERGQVHWKIWCPTVASSISRYETEVAKLIDTDGKLTKGIYLDTHHNVYNCWNPNHSHDAGDSRAIVEARNALAYKLSKGRDIVFAEGFSEEQLGTVDVRLFLGGTGTQDFVDVPLWEYIYGDVCYHVGWSGQSWSGTDSEWAAEIAKAFTFGSKANGSYTGNATLDTNVMDGTYSESLAVLKNRKPTSFSKSTYRKISGSQYSLGLPEFSADLRNSLVEQFGAPATFTRASIATVTDFEGLIKPVLSGEARFAGARRVYNYLLHSEDFSTDNWNTFQTATVTGTNQINMPADGDIISPTVNTIPTSTIIAGDTYVFTITAWATGDNIGKTLGLRLAFGTGGGQNLVVTLTDTPTRYSLEKASSISNPNAGTIYFGRYSGLSATATEVMIDNVQLERVTGQANQNPSEYVSTGVLSSPYHGANVDGVKYFSYQNGNTVSNNIVTEAKGDPISGLKGVLIEEDRENIVTYSSDVSSWTLFNTPIITESSIPSPFIAGTAWEITDDNGTDFEYPRLFLGNTVGSTDTITYTVYVAKDASPSAYPGIFLKFYGGTPISHDIMFDPSDGSWVTDPTANAYDSVAVEDYNSNWWKVVCIVTNNGTGNTGVDVRLYPAVSANKIVVAATATGTATFAEPQIEIGPFPTSYIPTNGSAVARDSDDLTYDFQPNALVGSILFDVEPIHSDLGAVASYGIMPNADCRFWYSASGNLTVYDGTNANYWTDPLTANVFAKYGVTWEDGGEPEISVYVNGNKNDIGNLDTDGFDAGSDPLSIGHWSTSPTSQRINGYYSNIRVYNKSLSQVHMEALTS